VTYDKPLFELVDGALSDSSVGICDNHKIWDLGAVAKGEILIQNWRDGQDKLCSDTTVMGCPVCNKFF